MIKLRPFQREGLRRVFQFKGKALIADEMGLGKTIQSLWWASKLPEYRPVVIVTLASIKYAWQAEARAIGLHAHVLEGLCPDRIKSVANKVIILNYDILHSWLPALLTIDPQIVILDEIHMLGNPKSRRTRCAKVLAERAPSRLGLSGTPFENNPIQLWSILNIIKPKLFPNRMKFAWSFTNPRLTPWGWKFVGAKNRAKLKRILRENVMIRRLKKDVAPELPDKTRQIIPFKLGSYVEYNQARLDFLNWLASISKAKAMRAQRNVAVTKIGYLFRLAARLKLPWTIQWVKDFFETHPEKKLVCLTSHTFVIEEMVKKFPWAIVVNGKVRGKKRDESIRRFQNDKNAKLFLGNWKAAGTGLNLQVCSNGVGLDYPWTPGVMLQGEQRLHRIGSEKKVLFSYLIAKDTIEEKWLPKLLEKMEDMTSILDGDSDNNLIENLLKNV